MAHLGIISPPVSGHLNPFAALGRELIRRGHRVTLIHMEDLREKAAQEGLEFFPIGAASHPVGWMVQYTEGLTSLAGRAALRYTLRAIVRSTVMFFEEGPPAIEALKLDALLVDQTEPVGASLAERVGIPFFTVCNALIMNREPTVPPPFTPWVYNPRWIFQLRNQIGYAASNLATRALFSLVRAYRAAWKLPPYTSIENSFSSRLIISQQPREFEYPRARLPEHFHFVGPLRDAATTARPFPWERLNGKPLIYGSLGSLQGGKEAVFKVMADACRTLPVQLVITHGRSLSDSAVQSLSASCMVVPYAPQLELMARAQLTLTHGGLNTVLDSLSQGVPMVVIPIAYEQAAIAHRVRWTGTGEVLTLSRLSVAALRQRIQRVLGSTTMLHKARTMQQAICAAGGARRAATLIEENFRAGPSQRGE